MDLESIKDLVRGSVWKHYKNQYHLYTIVDIAIFKNYHYPMEKCFDINCVIYSNEVGLLFVRTIPEFLEKFTKYEQ